MDIKLWFRFLSKLPSIKTTFKIQNCNKKNYEKQYIYIFEYGRSDQSKN